MKYRVYVYGICENYEDEIELDDSLTTEEVEQELKEYALGHFEWWYERVEEDKQ